jgi:hypothetical protein
MTIIYRPARADVDDRKFIVASWLDSYRDAKSAGIIPKAIWYDVMWPIIDALVARPRCTTVIAHDTAHDVLVGFASMEPGDRRPVLHYVYVKAPYRRGGIAWSMLKMIDVDPTAPFDYTCSTPMQMFLRDKIPHARWEPWQARNPS